MAITTAAAVVTVVANRDVNSSLINSGDIDAADWKYLRGGLMLTYQTNGETIYEAIIAAMGTGETYEVPGGFLVNAVSYYTMSAILGRLVTGVETRGAFEYRSPNAGKAQETAVADVGSEYMTTGAQWFDKAINWINENLKDDYSDVPNTNMDWVTGVGFDANRVKRVNVI